MPAPIARKVPTERTFHGHTYVDDYEWMRDKESAELIELLKAENAWTEERTAHLTPLREAIMGELASRTREDDTSVLMREGDWWYFTRTWEGKQYPAVFRIPVDGPDGPDHVSRRPEDLDVQAAQPVWDGNLLAEGEEYFATSGFAPSPDGKFGAIGVDFVGDEHFRLRVFDIETGHIVDDAVSGLGYGLAWTADSSAIVYARVNESWRTWQVWAHRIGTPTDRDRLLFQEDDERFDAGHYPSRDGRWIIVHSTSRSTAEVRLFDAADIEAPPILVCGRRPGLDYTVEPAGDHLLIVHNANRPDFEVAIAAIRGSRPEEWTPILIPRPGERVVGIDAYRDFAVVSMRSGGQTQLRVMARGAACNGAVAAGPTEWRQATPVPSEDLATIMHLPQSHWQTGEVVYMVESVLTPRTWVSYCPHTGESTVLKRLEVPNYDRDDYAQQGVWVTADDGTDIPMTIAYRKDLEPDGSNPGLIYGYGSYEVSYDPWFAPINVSALQRGVVLAFAHVRGGGEMGRAWYDDGKLLKKKNTFTDFIACAKWLHSSGWVADQRLAAEGSSAGGLLMGAVANLAPDQFRAIHADVPFVDALTTILRPELPLTVGEWEEWGNPIDSPEIYEYMRSYSPTENVVEAEYPAVLATTSFNDIRVFYVEPTKWVQILRERSSNDPIARPILEQIEMAAGHGGKLGRYDRWDKQSFELAWILDQIGATE